MNLINNIFVNYNYLVADYIGKFDYSQIIKIPVNIFVPVLLIAIFYLLGIKVYYLFFKKKDGVIDFFIKIAFGYILTASGIFLMGFFSILYLQAVWLYLLIISIIAIYPLSSLKTRLLTSKIIYKTYIEQFKKYKWANILILGFILIGFLRLIPPETGVDAVWYHTDFPKTYLKMHSMMNINPRGQYYPVVTPTLSDMLYVVTQAVSAKDSSRYLHFSFYVLVVLTLLTAFYKKYSFAPYAALLFVTSPIIIRHTSTAYAEFQWILCWLLAVLIITSKKQLELKNLIIAAILFGGALATKLWILPFYSVFFLYLVIAGFSNKRTLYRNIFLFTVIAFMFPALWYLRAYIKTGNPLFPAFWSYPSGAANSPFHLDFDLASIKNRITSLASISPLSFFGLIFLIKTPRKLRNLKFDNRFYIIFMSILVALQVLINYSFHRFIVPFYSVVALFLGFGISRFTAFNKYLARTFYFTGALLFIYYFTNTLLILPYGLGIANQNRYLTRILSGDASSYYDYENKFSPFITNNDIVAVYGIWGFYYADFNYFYSEDVFKTKERSLKILSNSGANKLLLKGGNIEWMCKVEKITDCSQDRYKLLTSYKLPFSSATQFLYTLDK
nr:hypothetical protein [Patescibacteria group bacterium]